MQFKHQYKKDSNRIKDEWRTPDYIFNPLNEVMRFTLDAAANDLNHLCKNYCTAERSGLDKLWYNEEAVFVNPPYTEGQYGHWIEKARKEFVVSGIWSALLIPASLETDAYIPVWEHARYLILPYKRVSYLSPDGVKMSGAPFSSAIPLFVSEPLLHTDIETLSCIGHVLSLSYDYTSKYRNL